MASTMLSARAAPSILYRFSNSTVLSYKYASVHIRPLALPLLPRLSLPIPAISLNLPSLPSLEEIWDGILKAVPKKKASHSRRRHRQMAGKALKDVTELCRCPACGGVKRMHFLCPTCAPSEPKCPAPGISRETDFTNAAIEYANMMASLFSAPKPQKTIKPSESKTPEVTTAYSTSAPKMGEVPIDLTQSQNKGEGANVDKKDGPQP